MPDRDASRTALTTAYLRAAHQILDAQPLVLKDPVALSLLGSGASQRILDSVERYQFPGAQALRSHVVLRSRFAEDRLGQAVQRGVSQYIILGAGFDTFAFRQPEWADSLTIVEVDHSATQALKRSRIAEAKLCMPANVFLVHIDFEKESLLDGLLRQGVSCEVPTFFSWLGVTMYLNEAAIDTTLRSIASFPQGSEIVLTYLQAPDSATGQESAQLEERVAEIGEPFVSYFEPEQIQTKLLNTGFAEAGLLTSEEAESRYYAGRPMDIPVPTRTGIAYAIR